jgi:hypothetical protein
VSERIHSSLTRRTLIGTLASGALALPTAAAAQSDESSTYTIRQGDRCIPITPLKGTEPASAFYDWRQQETQYSSAGTTALQKEDTTILFLYEDPDGNVSLVIVHEKYQGDNDGGSATFEVRGLPSGGSWVVKDDFYDSPSNYDIWDTGGSVDTIDWTWAGGRTDGGVFSYVGDNPDITIEPMFNEAATLFGEYYSGRVRGFEVLSGDIQNPDRHSLAMNQTLSIQGGTCEDTSKKPKKPKAPEEPEMPSAEPAEIDISLPSTVNAKKQGFMMVEIRSSGEFDASDLNLATLELDGASPVKVKQVPGKEGVIRIFFRVPSMNVHGSAGTRELELVGEGPNGETVYGSDTVRIVHGDSDDEDEEHDDGQSEGDENGNTQQRRQKSSTEHNQNQGNNGDDGGNEAESHGNKGGNGNGKARGKNKNDEDHGNDALDLVDDDDDDDDDDDGNAALDVLEELEDDDDDD